MRFSVCFRRDGEGDLSWYRDGDATLSKVKSRMYKIYLHARL